MHYPDPSVVIRRVTLRTLPDGRSQAIYRDNLTNPSAIRGQPVPILRGNLAFDLYIIPLDVYGEVIRAAAEAHPLNTPAKDIIYVPDPFSRAYTWFEHYSPKGPHGGENLQSDLKAIRNNVITHYFKKQREKGAFSLAPDAVRFNALRATAVAMCLSEDLVRRVLVAQGMHGLIAADNPNQRTRPGLVPHKFSKAYEHELKWKLLRSIVQDCRSGDQRHFELSMAATGGDGVNRFTLADLHDEFAPGGYPTHCPVTGEEMNWLDRKSYHSPRVGRKDLTKPFESGNVVLMSKLARKLTEGLSSTQAPRILKMLPEIVERYDQWCAQHPTAVPLKPKLRPRTNAASAAPAAPTPDAAPAEPTTEPTEPTTTAEPTPVLVPRGRLPTPDTDAFNPFTLPAEGEPEPAWVTALNNVTAGLPKPRFAPDFTKKN